ncbi:bifunctional 2-polyprenyl-6-hydroxyphenol methylase/3-demethylubiquinol 3-O-methyltransferase UbiG [Candidatus Hepatobacter penaei]|uniref:bifunctional 2-polyprenyl-6-hydroxyphenol methylase/3-demethylubiquinol 3-O-methyltransferase UbiG n=1 Tax=Candidatus Hepatobacter penaei TaxID=1274402 RepID=UPI00069867A0|nr:bifunctional 2-polyprenyl-6-hydroxyphenol methylase/3-demethylubiquinol 3-O-methyltransferase UbiG [Candidatus Hepatobacter penaei]
MARIIGEQTFHDHAEAWWDEKGPFGMLHALTPLRLSWLRAMWARHQGRPEKSLVRPWLQGFHVLDIGTGGGLLAEPLARQGAHVTGLDALPQNVDTARAHQAAEEAKAVAKAGAKAGARSEGQEGGEKGRLDLTYHALSLAAYRKQRPGPMFDLIVAFEVIEHTEDPLDFLSDIDDLLKPGGLCLLSTLNRTVASAVKAIGLAEYVLGWIPKGTHAWEAFLTPGELAHCADTLNWEVMDVQGVDYAPRKKAWIFSKKINTNYFTAFLKNEKESLR